jgi:hypothetical protein
MWHGSGCSRLLAPASCIGNAVAFRKELAHDEGEVRNEGEHVERQRGVFGNES